MSHSTIEIKMTKGYVAIIDECDSDLAILKWHPHTAKSIYPAHSTYAGKRIGKVFLHKIVLERMIGRPLASGEVPDHIDGDKLNNRRSNLRLATKQQNTRNSRKYKNNTSGYKGVHFHKLMQRWLAYIRVDRKLIRLGYFDTPEEAHSVYRKAAREHFGEFARYE